MYACTYMCVWMIYGFMWMCCGYMQNMVPRNSIFKILFVVVKICEIQWNSQIAIAKVDNIFLEYYNLCRCAVEAFRGLLKTVECEELLKSMDENDFDKLVDAEETLPHGMLFIAR